MSINGQGHSLTLVKGRSDFKVKCLTFGLYTQVSDSGPLGPLVVFNLLHPESPKLYGILAFLSAIGLKNAEANSVDIDKTAPA